MLLARDADDNFIGMPLVSRRRKAPADLVRKKPKLVAGTALVQHQIKIVLAEGIVLDDQVFLIGHSEQELAFILSQQATLFHCTSLHGLGLMIDGRPGAELGFRVLFGWCTQSGRGG